MITVRIPLDLAEEFRSDPILTVQACDMRGLIASLNAQYPGMGSWLSESSGRVRQHLSVFVDGQRLKPREWVATPLTDPGEVWILRAVSGG